MGDPVVVESWHLPRALSAVFPPFEELAEAMNLNLREGEATRLIGRALEIWGRPKPFHVSERLPGPEDCDAEGQCWWGDAGDDQFVPSWRLCEQPDNTHFNHWLPAHALPLPEVEAQ